MSGHDSDNAAGNEQKNHFHTPCAEEVLELLRTARRDYSHLLGPIHLKQLRPQCVREIENWGEYLQISRVGLLND